MSPSPRRRVALVDPRALRRFRRNRGAIFGAALCVFVVGVAIFGPLFAPHDPNEIYDAGLTESALPAGPTATFPLGADPLGRDELSRLLHGGQASMAVAFGATALAIFLGLLVGVLSGYFGGLGDTIAMRMVDVVLSLPFLLIAIVVNRVLDDPALWTLCLLLGGLSWTSLARVTRAKTQQVRELDMIAAARALGLGHIRILLRHVLPNVLSPAIVIGTTLVAQMIIAESAMSFLGLGVKPPTASWGSMLNDSVDMIAHAPRLVLFPGGAIVATVFGFNLLGEGLRDALDPKE